MFLPSNRPSKFVIIALGLAIILAGGLFGFLLSKIPGKSQTLGANQTTPSMIKTDTEVGSTDTKTFRDSAQGVLEAGGLSGEGTHRLTRDGGPSQTVYLISSTVDLEQFIGKKVEVWGETVKAVRAPWLMDVGRIKLLQ